MNINRWVSVHSYKCCVLYTYCISYIFYNFSTISLSRQRVTIDCRILLQHAQCGPSHKRFFLTTNNILDSCHVRLNSILRSFFFFSFSPLVLCLSPFPSSSPPRLKVTDTYKKYIPVTSFFRANNYKITSPFFSLLFSSSYRMRI